MAIRALNWAFSLEDVKKGAKSVLIVLANYANEKWQCYPSRENLAKKTGLSVRTVQTHLNWLVKNEYIARRKRRSRNGRFFMNVYTLNPNANFARPEKSQVQIPAEPCANNGSHQVQVSTRPSAESAPYTKEKNTKEEILKREKRPRAINWSISVYEEYFPNQQLPVFSQDIIINRIGNEDRWRGALSFWKGSDYRANSIPRLCDYYDELKNGKGNQSQPKTDNDRIRESAEFYSNYPA